MWTLQGYVNGRGQHELTDWFEGLPPNDQAAVVVALEQLLILERDYWRRPQFDTLHDMDGMGEIILGKVSGVQTRLVGFFGPKRVRHVFTVVLLVTKKQRVYSPRDWEKTALRRKGECEQDEAKAHVWNPHESIREAEEEPSVPPRIRQGTD